MAAAVFVIAFSGVGGGTETGTHSVTAPSADGQASSSPKCPSARGAVRFYARRLNEHRERMGQSALPTLARLTTGCPRYRAHVLQRKAHAWRLRADRWVAYQYDWRTWLPDKWQRIGACETGYGRRPGNWRHSNARYEGAFGFAKSSWDAFKSRADRKAGPYPEDAWQATPRQQYEVALAIWRVYGFSGWGCRGA